jgi:serine/threonine-protein kinase
VLRPALARTVVLVAIGALAVGAVVAGGTHVVDSSQHVSVPDLTELTPAEASRALAAAHLDDGRARYRVTREFPPGVVVGQSPQPFARARRSSAVDVVVAVAPTPAIVPDVGLGDANAAEKYLRELHFEPVRVYAYSDSVATGRVISQLPRPGDTASTGGNVALVVSLGPGSSVQSVPSVIGKRLSAVRPALVSARVFARELPVIARGVAEGVVVDQVPAAGSRVTVGTTVAVSVATAYAEM